MRYSQWRWSYAISYYRKIAGREIEPLGIVEGSSVQTVHAGKDIMNSLKTLVGGELTSYTEMMEKARTLATDKMVRNAEQMVQMQ